MLIYVIDDEKAVLHHTEKSIKTCFPNDEVVSFLKSKELISAFEEKPADIVFMDIEMPGIGGIELAGKLNKIKPTVNIIFVTGYEQYAVEAFNVFASDYMKKPCTPEKIKESVKKLRYPIETPKDIFIKTFGNFDVFYKGIPIHFRSELEKEMLAYLVDREGALVSRQEIGGILFEDDYSRAKQVHLSKIAERLSSDLSEASIGNLFISENGYRVDLSICDCDMMEWKKGNPKYMYSGEYMEQYSFSEYRKGMFEK